MYCGICKKRKTTAFCFVHKRSVCDNCLLIPPTATNGKHCAKDCFVSTYSKWIADADYDWPPRCGECNRALATDDQLARLPCYCLYHTSCLTEWLGKQSQHTPASCPNCGPFSSKQMQSPLLMAVQALPANAAAPARAAHAGADSAPLSALTSPTHRAAPATSLAAASLLPSSFTAPAPLAHDLTLPVHQRNSKAGFGPHRKKRK
eukprot:g2747.t1